MLADRPPGLEAVRRRHADGTTFMFLVNHAEAPATVAAAGTDLLTGDDVRGEVTVPAGGVVVLRSSGEEE